MSTPPFRHSFTCTDHEGKPHTYEVTAHRGREGMAPARRLGALLARPLTALLRPLASVALSARARGQKAGPALRDPENLSAALAGVDMREMGSDLADILLGMPDELVFAVLKYTTRDGHSLVDQSGTGATLAFDEAYARNYMELAAALGEVVTYNNFLPVPNTLIVALKSVLSQGMAAVRAELSAVAGDSPPANESGSRG